ncbi:MAG: hypothetical protein Q8L27_02300, partial [archaeon]|nr:hypothetical protein [archaeon]
HSGVQNFKANVYLYSPEKDYGINWKEIKYINTTEKNPNCVLVKNGVATIKIERKYEGYSVYVSAK